MHSTVLTTRKMSTTLWSNATPVPQISIATVKLGWWLSKLVQLRLPATTQTTSIKETPCKILGSCVGHSMETVWLLHQETWKGNRFCLKQKPSKVFASLLQMNLPYLGDRSTYSLLRIGKSREESTIKILRTSTSILSIDSTALTKIRSHSLCQAVRVLSTLLMWRQAIWRFS